VCDEKEFDSLGQYLPSFGMGILINDVEDQFGLMDNDSSPQLRGKDYVGNETTWLTSSESTECVYT
jgi:hypothetical protein